MNEREQHNRAGFYNWNFFYILTHYKRTVVFNSSVETWHSYRQSSKQLPGKKSFVLIISLWFYNWWHNTHPTVPVFPVGFFWLQLLPCYDWIRHLNSNQRNGASVIAVSRVLPCHRAVTVELRCEMSSLFLVPTSPHSNTYNF